MTPADRLIAKLGDPDATWTTSQVAFLLATDRRWVAEALAVDPPELSFAAGHAAGYRDRVAEENAAYPPSPFRVVTSAGEDAIRVHRSREGVDAPGPREGDYQGGAVEVW